mmetsp:Transcript_5148/g.9045  ORF Transcript_5148/g.9045 Transcript_5148/m.9045 type:complete len:225 (+) Transcript_5148:638-1312(+)
MNESHFDSTLNGSCGTFVMGQSTLVHNGVDALVKDELSGNFGALTKGNNRAGWTVCRNKTRQIVILPSQYNNGPRIPFRRHRDGRFGNTSTHASCMLFGIFRKYFAPWTLTTNEIRSGLGKPFRAQNDLIHHSNSLHGIFSLGRFSAQHDSIRTIIDSIRHVRHFGTGGTGIFSHTFQHLGRHNHGLADSIACGHHFFLGIGHLLNGHFDSQVTACHHDTITGL